MKRFADFQPLEQLQTRNLFFRHFPGFFILFFFFAFLMWCCPAASDDYEFAALRFSGISDFFTYLLHYGNGRLLGNAGAIAMSHTPFLAVFGRSFLLTSLVYLLPAALGLRGRLFRVFSFLLLFGIEPRIFSEIFSWISGFANYIPPIWISLLLVCLLRFYGKAAARFRMLLAALIFLLALAAQLYVEHSALIQLLLALCALIFCRKKQTCLPSLLWFAGALLGFFVLMGIPAVFPDEFSPVSGYRSANFQSFSGLVHACMQNTIRICNTWLGITGCTLASGALLTVWLGREHRSEQLNRLLSLLGFVALLLLLFGSIYHADYWYGSQALLQRLLCCFPPLASFAVWVLASWTLEAGELRNKLLFLLAFAFLSLLMLLPIYPFAMRANFQAYLFVTAALLLCLDQLLQRRKPESLPPLRRLFTLVATLLALTLALVFYDCRCLENIRQEHILRELEAGASHIEVFEIPHDYAAWDGCWSLPMVFYRETPGDVSFSDCSYLAWTLKYPQA